MREPDSADIKCQNPKCPAQVENHILNFVSRSAMDIKGFGESAVRVLIEAGFLKSIADIYTLKEHRAVLIEKGLIGKEKSTDNLLAAIEKSKENRPERLLTGLGIPGIGRAAARSLMLIFHSIDRLAAANLEAIEAVPDLGEISAKAIRAFFDGKENRDVLEKLRAAGVSFGTEVTEAVDTALAGKVFVLTGTLPTMGRRACQELIESHGGKVTGSISKRTNYLVAGEAAGSKLQKAEALGIPVLTEDALKAMLESNK